MLGGVTTCSISIASSMSTTSPAHSSATAPKAGGNIDADISADARGRCPRWRIQATIGAVMMTAIPSSISAGTS